MKRTFNEVPSGVGAGYHWVGNKDVGEGSMKITDARPAEHLGLDLDFIAPFEAHNRSSFDFVKGADGTAVTWTLSGTNNLMAKAMSVFMDMDKMVGPDFEKGLASLKTLSEAAAKEAAKPAAPGTVEEPAGTP